MNTINIPLKDLKCIIFDFDGVILDSSTIKSACFDKLYSQFENIHKEAMNYHYENKGMSRFLQFDYVANNLLKASNPDKTIQNLANQYAEIVFKQLVQAPFIKGAQELLDFLQFKMPLYIISSSPSNELEELIFHRNLKNYFKSIYGSIDQKGKYICKIYNDLSLNSDSVLYVGDTLKDLNAARQSRVHFCGIQNKLVDFSGHGCWFVNDLIELKLSIEKYIND